jgi:hypothetical protein
MQIQLNLKKGTPLEVKYPEGFKDKSVSMSKEMHLSLQPKMFTVGEYFLIKKELEKRSREKELEMGTVLIDETDPLLTKTHKEIDSIEEKLSFSNTKKNPKGGKNSIHQRVISIRERGYFGNGLKQISGK